jgi:hypothetical protein
MKKLFGKWQYYCKNIFIINYSSFYFVLRPHPRYFKTKSPNSYCILQKKKSLNISMNRLKHQLIEHKIRQRNKTLETQVLT